MGRWAGCLLLGIVAYWAALAAGVPSSRGFWPTGDAEDIAGVLALGLWLVLRRRDGQ